MYPRIPYTYRLLLLNNQRSIMNVVCDYEAQIQNYVNYLEKSLSWVVFMQIYLFTHICVNEKVGKRVFPAKWHTIQCLIYCTKLCKKIHYRICIFTDIYFNPFCFWRIFFWRLWAYLYKHLLICIVLTLKWSRGVPMEPKISFRASEQKCRISWRRSFLSFTCLPPCIFWHVFEKNRARVARKLR